MVWNYQKLIAVLKMNLLCHLLQQFSAHFRFLFFYAGRPVRVLVRSDRANCYDCKNKTKKLPKTTRSHEGRVNVGHGRLSSGAVCRTIMNAWMRTPSISTSFTLGTTAAWLSTGESRPFYTKQSVAETELAGLRRRRPVFVPHCCCKTDVYRRIIGKIILMIIVITTTMFMVLWSWPKSLQEKSSPGSFDERGLSAGWPPTLRSSQSSWAVSPP